MPGLQFDQIQGLVFSGYSDKEHAAYLLLTVKDPAKAGAWLAKLGARVTNGTQRQSDRNLNVAFTASGLRAFGLDERAMASFPLEFVEGMSGSAKRAQILGDTENSGPELWRWGGAARSVDVLLAFYANSATVLANELANERAAFEGALKEVYSRDTAWLPSRREHFGFADGIAQPEIRELGKPERPGVTQIAAGEFILGYANEYGKVPFGPEAPSELDVGSVLEANGSPATKDLGKNGSYLVVRELDQAVAQFWTYMKTQAGGDENQAVAFASKCVGRWPSGAPLALSPERDDPSLATRNDFAYAETDRGGMRCPAAAHIRRTNPRDSLDPGIEESTNVSHRHSLIRRGRSYGPLIDRFAPDDAKERGLFFVCVNANIARQFEFVQQTWTNNPKFGGLYDERDPLLGDQGSTGGTFTIPERPIRRRLTAMPRFTQVRGGGYFFLPSIRALKFIANVRGSNGRG